MNVADLMTRGAGPKDLTEDSEWQKGPEFLYLPESEWPKRSTRDAATASRGNLEKIQKKSFVAALNRTYLRVRWSNRPPAGLAVDVRCFSDLTRLVKTVAWVWRAAKRFLQVKTGDVSKWEAVSGSGIIMVSERQDAFRDLCLAVQTNVTFPSTTTNRLVVYRDMEWATGVWR